MALGEVLEDVHTIPAGHRLVSSSQTVPVAPAKLKLIMAVETVAGALKVKLYLTHEVFRLNV